MRVFKTRVLLFSQTPLSSPEEVLQNSSSAQGGQSFSCTQWSMNSVINVAILGKKQQLLGPHFSFRCMCVASGFQWEQCTHSWGETLTTCVSISIRMHLCKYSGNKGKKKYFSQMIILITFPFPFCTKCSCFCFSVES